MAKENETKSVFAVLNDINVNGHTEKKNNLTYLSWSWAWQMVKGLYPNATYTIYESDNGWPYFTDGRTCWVKTGVTIEGLEHIEYLPIMDFRNQSIPADKVTSMDMNKAIQRSLTKAIARHGLGLYIYAGEDLPEVEMQAKEEEEMKKQQADKEAMQELDYAFQLILPNIKSAPSRAYLQNLHEQNKPLHNYQPFKDAMNKRYKEVA